MASRIEKLRDLFLLVFFLLVITIIFTPLFVTRGFSIFSEEVLESVLLFFQVSVAWRIFRLYEITVKSREGEIQKLETEYQKREKELLEAFAYLGKVNVQVSLIKSFLQKLKAPADRKEAETYINEILNIALSLSGKDWVTLRAIDTRTQKTLNEYWAKGRQETEIKGIKIGNKEIVKWEKSKEEGERNNYLVFGSSGSDLASLKVFWCFLMGKK